MKWKKLVLIALVAGGVAFVPAQRTDAQVGFSIGIGFPGYYGYYPTYYRPYYGYSYYRPYPYYGYYYGPSFYWYGGHRYYSYRHHRHHRYYHRY